MARPRTLQEFSAIAELSALFQDTRALANAGVEVGIGDDAAVLQSRGRLVWTVDAAVEHVHFERGWLTLADVGWRSFNAAVSDVCAMAAEPLCALSSVIFPAQFSARDLNQLGRGQRDAARSLGCPIVGGNLSRGAELSITTTVLGRARRPLLRSGALPGDELWLCGNVGLAGAGLKLLQHGSRAKTQAGRRALAAFRRPEAKRAFGLGLQRGAHAAIDLSDGLCGDAAHLARASKARLVIATPLLERALSPALRALAPELGVSALELALYGGEDYALLAAGPTRARPDGARLIGCVERGQGVWLSSGGAAGAAGASSRRVRARPGFEHGAARVKR